MGKFLKKIERGKEKEKDQLQKRIFREKEQGHQKREKNDNSKNEENMLEVGEKIVKNIRK